MESSNKTGYTPEHTAFEPIEDSDFPLKKILVGCQKYLTF